MTKSRFMVHSQTYAMSGITSVAAVRHDPSRIGPIILIAMGLLPGLFGGGDLIFGALIFIGIGVAWWVLAKPKFSVLLHSASGEAKALTSKDADFTGRVVAALNEAIIARG